MSLRNETGVPATNEFVADIEGTNSYHWVFHCKDAVVHQPDYSRAARVVDEMMDGRVPEVGISDRYSAQQSHGIRHQTCLAHLARDTAFALEHGSDDLPFRFKLWLGKVFDLAMAITNSAASTVAKKKRGLEKQLAALLVVATRCDLARELQAKIGRARDQLLTFCDYPGEVDVTNNTSERKLRPCVIQRKIKAPAAEESRDRVLTDDEIRPAWDAFESVGWPFGPIAKLLLLTGARRDEVGSATWSEIDLAAKTWTIAKERSKNGVAHEIPLSDAAVAILAALPRIGERKDALVFSTTGWTAVSGFSRAKEQIDAVMLDALRAAGNVEAPARWTFHDLRRTAASSMAGIGIPPHVVEAALNHKSGTIKGVAAVYNRYSYAAEKRQALDAWARRLDAILSEQAGSNVVTFAHK